MRLPLANVHCYRSVASSKIPESNHQIVIIKRHLSKTLLVKPSHASLRVVTIFSPWNSSNTSCSPGKKHRCRPPYPRPKWMSVWTRATLASDALLLSFWVLSITHWYANHMQQMKNKRKKNENAFRRKRESNKRKIFCIHCRCELVILWMNRHPNLAFYSCLEHSTLIASGKLYFLLEHLP